MSYSVIMKILKATGDPDQLTPNEMMGFVVEAQDLPTPSG